MTVFDAQAIIALLRGEPAARTVASLLARADRRPSISAANVAEVVDILVRLNRRSEDEVTERLDWLAIGGLETIPVDGDIGRLAGLLHARHYHRTRSPLSLADCLALATALVRTDELATADRPLATAARAVGCSVVSLES